MTEEQITRCSTVYFVIDRDICLFVCLIVLNSERMLTHVHTTILLWSILASCQFFGRVDTTGDQWIDGAVVVFEYDSVAL